MKKSFRLKAQYILALIILLPSVALAQESMLWKQFKEAKQTGSEPTLPDYSYAGYDYSESPIPDTSTWTVFNVADYGALPDDGVYDDDGIQAAIDAASVEGGGVVFFPPGRFIISPNETVGENIFIRSSNIVLKGSGAGEGGTEIFKDKMKVRRGRYMFEIGPANRSEPKITNVTKDAKRETFQIEVASAENLSPGQRIKLRSSSVEMAASYYSPLTIYPAWSDLLEKGFKIRELHTIESINGNVLTLREPLHIDLQPSVATTAVLAYNMLENIGVEDIRFKGNWNSYPEEFVHHKDDIHDWAWNAMRFDRVENSWIRNSEFKDWNQVIYVDGSAAMTIENITMSGKKGHASIHTRGSYGILVQDVVDLAGHHHGPSVGYWNCGTVYLRYQMAEGQRIDSHTGSPYATLMDNVNNGNFSGNGGSHSSYPHHGKYFVAWNFLLKGGSNNYDFWREQRNLNTLFMPYFIGLQGKPITMKDGTFAVNEMPGQAVEPASLFEAQLKLRLDGDSGTSSSSSTSSSTSTSSSNSASSSSSSSSSASSSSSSGTSSSASSSASSSSNSSSSGGAEKPSSGGGGGATSPWSLAMLFLTLLWARYFLRNEQKT